MKKFMGMRKMVSIHQGRERSDVFLVILLPAFLMLFASYTNAWALTQGHLLFDKDHVINTVEALLRGLFTEVLVFAMFMMARILWSRGGWSRLVAGVPGGVGMFGVLVSAGSGLAWAAHSGDIQGMVKMVAELSWPFMAQVFQVGLGLLFPVALAVLAVYDAGHVIREHVGRGSEMQALAVHVESAEHFQTMMLEVQKQENEKMRPVAQQIAQANAQRAVDAAKSGDLSFGLKQAVQQTQQLSQMRTSVTPLGAPALPQLPAGSAPVQRPPVLQAPPQPAPVNVPFAPPLPQPAFAQSPITAQVGPAPATPTGGTQHLSIPPQQPGAQFAPPPSQGQR